MSPLEELKERLRERRKELQEELQFSESPDWMSTVRYLRDTQEDILALVSALIEKEKAE